MEKSREIEKKTREQTNAEWKACELELEDVDQKDLPKKAEGNPETRKSETRIQIKTERQSEEPCLEGTG
jgi:hypothetical protein